MRLLPAIFALGGLALAASADDGGMQQSTARQEQIRGQAQALGIRLDDVIAEYQRNGLATGDDFQSLRQARTALGSLTDQEMEEVAALLMQAGTDPARMAKAYAGEKDISLRLKQILAAHENQQDIADLARAVRELADRQTANLSTAIDTRQLSAQDQSANGKAAVTASEQAQQSEQTDIAGEVKLLSDKLTQLATEPGAKDAAAALAQAQPDAASAADALGADRLDDAVTAEDSVRGKLEDAARALAPAGQPQPVSGQAAELSDLARQERALAQLTAQAAAALKKATDAQSPDATGKAMDDQMQLQNSSVAQALARDGITSASSADQIQSAPAMQSFLATRAAALTAQAQAAQAQMTALSAAQAALAAKARMAREDVENGAQAAAPLAGALAQMTGAQQALAQGNGDQALQGEAAAAAQLDQAQRLAQQARATGPQTGQPRQPAPQERQELANLSQQLAGLGRLIDTQQQLAIETEKAADSPKQSLPKARQLAARQAALQKQAEDAAGHDANNPGLAHALAGADAAMGDAARKLGNGSAADSEPAQQAALAAMYKAQDALADRMQSLGGQPSAQGRAGATAALGKAGQQVASAQAAMASGGPGNGALKRAATQLGEAERAMRRAGAQPDALPQAARDAMRGAEQALGRAAAAAAAGDGRQANIQSAQAGDDIAAAQSALGKAQTGIQGLAAQGNTLPQPGGKPSDGNSQAQGTATSPGSQATSGGNGASEKNWSDQAGAAKAAPPAAAGAAQYAALPPRDRAAIQQSQSEKYPQEYGSMIEEYMRSLSADPGAK